MIEDCWASLCLGGGPRTETVVGSIEDLEVEVGSSGGEGGRIVEMLRVAKHLLERIKTDMGARASVLREGRQQLLGPSPAPPSGASSPTLFCCVCPERV